MFEKLFQAQSCDACKMFFRRVVLLNLQYFCDNKNRCFDSQFPTKKEPKKAILILDYIHGDMLPKCKSCRYRRCLYYGMTTNKMTKIKTCKLESVVTLIRDLLNRDELRDTILMTKFSFGNPTLNDIVANHGTPDLVPLVRKIMWNLKKKNRFSVSEKRGRLEIFQHLHSRWLFSRTLFYVWIGP